MKKLYILLGAAALLVGFTTIYLTEKNSDFEIKEVEALVLKSYVKGAFNDMNYEDMAAGFHEDFAIFRAEGENLVRYEIADWVENTKKKKESADWKLEDNIWEHKFPVIDITETSAVVKVELYRNDKHIFTDYLSLLKFDSGWKIVGKVYTRHN